MRQNRIFAHILLLCMILSLLPFSANASESSVEQQIIDSCTYNQVADISQHNLTDTELEELFLRLIYEGKLPWYAANTYKYYYDKNTGLMLEFHPEPLSKEHYDRMTYEQKVAEVLDACVHEGMEKWQIALAIHDYLIVNCIYDESLKLDTGYDLLVKGSTVCSGYAALYQDLLLRAGIPCLQVDSDPMNHVWNLVQLDGKWYHVDVTWDDPSPDTKGYVSHTYFLRTDEQMKAGDEPHHDWKTDITCTDTRYSDAFWANIQSHILFTDAKTCYYIRDKELVNSIYKRDIPSGEEKRLYKENGKAINIGHGNYIYQHTGLSLWNDRLWFCTMDKVYSMDLNGKDVRTEYTYNLKAENRFLAGCFVTDDTIELSASDHDGNAKPLTHTLAASGVHVHSYTQTVTAPTCTDPGYTVSDCQCGITAKGDIVAPNGHDLKRTTQKIATFFSDGYEETVCNICGQAGEETLPQIDFWLWLDEYSTHIFTASVAVISIISFILRKRKKKRASQTVG